MTVGYNPVFGVEPFDALGSPEADEFGGGAVFTQQNLLVSLWKVNGAPFNPSLGLERVKMATVSTGVEAFGPGYTKNVFPSRLSARFNLLQENEDEAGVYLAILNPPAELKQLALDPANLAEVDPSVPVFGYTLNSSQNIFFSFLSWTTSYYAVGNAAGTDPLVAPDIAASLIGTPIMVPIPVYQTNGADGVAPVPFGPLNTPAEIVDAVNAIKRGANFYVPLVFQLATNVSAVVDVRWQFSGASRS